MPMLGGGWDLIWTPILGLFKLRTLVLAILESQNSGKLGLHFFKFVNSGLKFFGDETFSYSLYAGSCNLQYAFNYQDFFQDFIEHSDSTNTVTRGRYKYNLYTMTNQIKVTFQHISIHAFKYK